MCIFNIRGKAWCANPNVLPAFTKQPLATRLKLYQTLGFTILADATLNSPFRTAKL